MGRELGRDSQLASTRAIALHGSYRARATTSSRGRSSSIAWREGWRARRRASSARSAAPARPCSRSGGEHSFARMSDPSTEDPAQDYTLELYKSLRSESAMYIKEVPAIWLQKFILAGAMIAFLLTQHEA